VTAIHTHSGIQCPDPGCTEPTDQMLLATETNKTATTDGTNHTGTYCVLPEVRRRLRIGDYVRCFVCSRMYVLTWMWSDDRERLIRGWKFAGWLREK